MLLLAGIPVYVWLKWRQASSPSSAALSDSAAATNGSTPESRELVGAVD